MSKALLVFTALLLFSCSSVEGPVIYFSNASADPVKNIECVWAEKNSLSLGALNPGDTRSQSFFISGYSKFFGPVYITWSNARGERMSKNFNFKKENLPSIEDKTTYNYVQLYFDQNDIEVSSSDVVDLSGKVRRMEQVMNKYHDDYIAKRPRVESICANNTLGVCQNADSTSLISFKRKQVDYAPGAN